ncbi:MAG: TIGR00730 family Rossman fold protein [Chitinophagaceae bacterium]|nr:TIGR00730 family Rossman fold protein [Chitinophagaceae bacterium]
MKRITVFCGSASGVLPVYSQAALELGQMLAKRNIGLVYGGAQIGLMGTVADAVLHAGGEVIGVIPHFLGQREIAHENLTELIRVNDMHERKMKMNELSDGVIALPGGYGTLDELFEMLTWAQLNLHAKPIGLLNINGYYDPLLTFVDHMTEQGFVHPEHRDLLLSDTNLTALFSKMGLS